MGRILGRHDDDIFRPRLGSGYPEPTHQTGLRRLGGHRTKAVSRGRHLPMTPSAKGGDGTSSGGGGTSSAQAVVKVKYMPAGRVSGYSQYMTKDTDDHQQGQGEGYSEYMTSHGGQSHEGKATLFTREEQVVDLEAFIARSRGDPRAWTMILSPADGHRLDMERYTQQFVEQVERDLGTRIDWIAVVHTNTDHHHAHILLRGRDIEGREFRITRDYLSQGLRTRAIEIAQRHVELGLIREVDHTHVRAREPVHDRQLSRVHGTRDTRHEGWTRAVEGRERDRGMER
jgi:hypothetical protein